MKIQKPLFKGLFFRFIKKTMEQVARDQRFFEELRKKDIMKFLDQDKDNKSS